MHNKRLRNYENIIVRIIRSSTDIQFNCFLISPPKHNATSKRIFWNLIGRVHTSAGANQSSGNGRTRIAAPREDGLHDHVFHAGVQMLVGEGAAVDGGGGERLLQVDGADDAQPAEVALIRPNGRRGGPPSSRRPVAGESGGDGPEKVGALRRRRRRRPDGEGL